MGCKNGCLRDAFFASALAVLYDTAYNPKGDEKFRTDCSRFSDSGSDGDLSVFLCQQTILETVFITKRIHFITDHADSALFCRYKKQDGKQDGYKKKLRMASDFRKKQPAGKLALFCV